MVWSRYVLLVNLIVPYESVELDCLPVKSGLEEVFSSCKSDCPLGISGTGLSAREELFRVTVVCIEGCVPTYQLGSGFLVEEFSPSDRLDRYSIGSLYG